MANPAGDAFMYALAKALKENSTLTIDDLEKTEKKIVSGYKYRFTFKELAKPIVIYVPLDFD